MTHINVYGDAAPTRHYREVARRSPGYEPLRVDEQKSELCKVLHDVIKLALRYLVFAKLIY